VERRGEGAGRREARLTFVGGEEGNLRVVGGGGKMYQIRQLLPKGRDFKILVELKKMCRGEGAGGKKVSFIKEEGASSKKNYGGGWPKGGKNGWK